MSRRYNRFAACLDEVRGNFARFQLLDDQVRFLKGWFKDTLPGAPIERLAILRLDGDYYQSTMDGLINLYDKLSPGGYVIVDDYGETSWTSCARAVDEFRAERGITEPLIRVDSKCYHWRRMT
jgi:Macrocin-O-methyltransferase (TylF)